VIVVVFTAVPFGVCERVGDRRTLERSVELASSSLSAEILDRVGALQQCVSNGRLEFTHWSSKFLTLGSRNWCVGLVPRCGLVTRIAESKWRRRWPQSGII
jgi:hypothetical protein